MLLSIKGKLDYYEIQESGESSWPMFESVSKVVVIEFPALSSMLLVHCTMLPLSTKSCLKSSKLRPILNGHFYHAISKTIGLNVLGSKQPREILVFVILKL